MKRSRITMLACVFVIIVAALLLKTGAVQAHSTFTCGKSNCLVSHPPSSPAVKGGLGGLSVLSATDIWAAGNTFTNLGYPRTLTEHWDGTQWSIVASQDVQGASGDSFRAIAALSPQDVWAVGYASFAYDQALAEHWDGTQWNIVTVPDPAREVQLLGVAAVSTNDVWAVGFYSAQTDFGSVIEHWDGSS